MSERPARLLAIAVLVVGTALFGLAIALREVIDPWWSNAVIAAVCGTGAAIALGPRLRSLTAVRAGPALAAAALGLALVGLTHASYRAITALAPGLGLRVELLYDDISGSPHLATAIALIAVIAVTEELLWRGLAVELLERWTSRVGVAAAAVALYAIPQIIGGSPILVLAAVGLGLILTVQRLAHRRLTEPVITHAVWSISMFGLLPLA